MLTTSVQRRISQLSRSWGWLDRIWRQCCLEKPAKASTSARSGLAKAERARVATMVCVELGTRVIRLRKK